MTDISSWANTANAPSNRPIPPKHPSFVAMQYYWGILNRTYQVFVTGSNLCAARVSGVLAAPTWPTAAWNDPHFYVSTKLAKRYADLDLDTPAFCQRDRANFQILRASITHIDYFRHKWGMGSVPYSGRLVVHCLGSRSYEFILLGSQDPNRVQDLIMVGK